MQAFGPEYDYTAEAGVMVLLGHHGLARFEPGLVRAEDIATEPPPWAGDGASEAADPNPAEGNAVVTEAGNAAGDGGAAEADEDDRLAPLSN